MMHVPRSHFYSMAAKFSLVVFDFDGTLADSGAWFAGVFNDIAQRFGFRSLSTAEMQQLRGLGNREIVRQLGIPLWKMPFIARYARQRVSADAAAIPLFAGVQSMLQQLHAANVSLAIVSSNSEANIRRILGPDSASRISYYACGASLFGKARLLRKVMKDSSTQARATLCVGDETRDIEAARSVGAIAAAVSWGYATPEILRTFEPDVLFDRVEAVVDYCLSG
jgi:phosphoglycolate phosphatase